MTRKKAISILLLILIAVVIAAGALILVHRTAYSPHSENLNLENPPLESASESSSLEEESLIPESSQESPESSESSDDSPEAVITITIPDCSTYPEILQQLASVLGLSVEVLEEQTEALLPLLPDPEAAGQCFFPLEGYILSGTYTLPEDTNPLQNLLLQSLDRIDQLLTQDTLYTTHEILTAASIIEIESSCGGNSDHHPDEMPHIASVIVNRLSQNMQLQMDVTFQYGEETLIPHGADESVLEQYNTYTAPALPIGPIGSPSEAAIAAALNPEHSDDLFFVFDEHGNYYYAAVYEDHLANCRLIGIR